MVALLALDVPQPDTARVGPWLLLGLLILLVFFGAIFLIRRLRRR